MSDRLHDRLPALWADPARSSPLRPLLTPLSLLYAAGARAVDVAWSRGWRTALRSVLPTISVGNLSVGGTGKTPVASWVARWILDRHVVPAIVLRGYGDDEPEVHRRLVPEAIVVTDADRVRGIATARVQGAQIAVLDDGFQHRRAARDLDMVLLSVEQVEREIDAAGRWRPQLLPAGPYRESVAALRRAQLIGLTRKQASPVHVERVAEAVRREIDGTPLVSIALVPDRLAAADGATTDAIGVAGQRVLAIAGIGAPALFAAQLERLGAAVTLQTFADHHPFTSSDAARLAVKARDFDMAICTLKDAVKLIPLWPAEATPLSYLTQRCVIESGAEQLHELLEAVVARIT
jgi:tetraacyldisaccharide 4'-kinase